MPRTDRASRTISAPVERVYAALVDPDALVQWLPPSGMTGRFERFDARPGGSYRLVLTYDDPAEARPKSTDDADVVPDGISAVDHQTAFAASLAKLAALLET